MQDLTRRFSFHSFIKVVELPILWFSWIDSYVESWEVAEVNKGIQTTKETILHTPTFMF